MIWTTLSSISNLIIFESRFLSWLTDFCSLRCSRKKFFVRFKKSQSLNQISNEIWKEMFFNSLSFMVLINFFFVNFCRSIDLATRRKMKNDVLENSIQCIRNWPHTHQMFGWNSFLLKVLCQKWTLVKTFNWLIALLIRFSFLKKGNAESYSMIHTSICEAKVNAPNMFVKTESCYT